MNYEPRHRAAQGEPDHDSDGHNLKPERSDEALVDALAADAPTPEAAAQLHRLYQDHGEPFAAYLTLDDVDPYVHDIAFQFSSVYIGRYFDRESLVADTIASFDWGADLDRLLAGDPQLRHMVTFDRDAIWGFAADHYDLVVRPGGIYAFECY